MMDCWKFFSRSKVKCSLVHFYLGFEALFYFAYPFELLVHGSVQVCDLQENNVFDNFGCTIPFPLTLESLAYTSIPFCCEQTSIQSANCRIPADIVWSYIDELFLSFYQLIYFTLFSRKHHLVFYMC